MNHYLNLAAIRTCTETEGPGKRFALWVQGCLKRCPGCCNKKMQEIKKNHIVDVDDLFDSILQAKNQNGIEGISFIGGEPLLQVEGLSYLAWLCQKEQLSVLVFTGFTYEKIMQSNDENLKRLIENTDILVDGLFDEKQLDEERDWVGSKNQKVYFLSDKYKPGVEYQNHARGIEIRVTESELLINGWPFWDNDF